MPKSNKSSSHRICEICGIQEARQRNSRFFATFPIDEVRCREWVRVTGKEDLVHVPIEKLCRNRYVCGDHFEKKYFNRKGNRLTGQAIPTWNLTSVPLNTDQMSDFPQHVFSCQVPLKQSSNLASRKQNTINNARSPLSEIQDEEDREPAIHEDVICDNCLGKIIGFRYKCVTCDNYDLCQKCEMLQSHSNHYMLRIPRCLKFEIAGNFIVKLREILKSDQTLQELVKHTDKASKSVKENVRNDDKAIDLTENVKKTIQREVDRALKSVKMQKKNKENRKRHVTNTNDDTPSKKQRTNEDSVLVQVERIEDAENIKLEIAKERAPELVFAVVNETELTQNLVKAEVCSTGPHLEDQDNLRTFYLKTGIDLSQIMIQVVPSSEEPS